MREERKAGRREWIGLVVLVLPLLLVSMDVSVLYFTVPFISRDLAPTSTEQLWIFDIYGFVLAGFLITMGALGDRVGRRRLLMIGAVGFSAASALAAYSGSAPTLIAARAILGVAGATLMPSTLALIRNMFHDEKQRGTAIAVWTVAMTSGIALGPIVSGVLVEHFWWGSVFLINIPAMVLLLVLAPILLPEHRNPVRGRFDVAGAVLSVAAVLPVIWGIKEIAAHGVDAIRIAAIVAGLVIVTVFVRRQQRHPDPMLDLAVLRRPAFAGSVVVSLLATFAMVGFAIFSTQYLQLVLGMSPLEGALWSLAPTLAVGAAAPLVSVLARRGVDRATIVAAGFVVAVGGFVLLSTVPVESGLWVLLAGAGCYAAGLVVVMSTATELAIGTVPPERAGSSSALMETASEFGGALGIAILGSIGTAVYRSHLAGQLPAAARETLSGAVATAAHLPEPAAGQVLGPARAAFVESLHTVAWASAGIMLIAAVVALTLLRRLPAGAPQDRPARTPDEVAA
ncbi:MFS transporter [Actinoplanes awajinensis]|uniref:MFS transporter n=1 Tax=Actinoplanes awajinensis subsp. mycoplanecinus TaxID=135947 RepID=A0A0X3UVV7_9ACTN|nr:MFS transporter [Actinoplanes awajinensis]KUL36683.1 MFS transporter [Actinoplanes awajinensis subsp. mycoplanecinus]